MLTEFKNEDNRVFFKMLLNTITRWEMPLRVI